MFIVVNNASRAACQTFGGNFVTFCKVADLGAPVGVMNDGLVLLKVSRSVLLPGKDPSCQRRRITAIRSSAGFIII